MMMVDASVQVADQNRYVFNWLAHRRICARCPATTYSRLAGLAARWQDNHAYTL